MNNDNATIGSNFELFLKTPKGIEAALRVSLSDVPPQKVGENTVEGVAALAAYMARLDAQLAQAGFTRSDRLDKPARGGGGQWQKPSDPPPPDIQVPVHCGEPMKYRAEKKVFDCAKGANCATPREYQGKKYGASVWERDIREGKA